MMIDLDNRSFVRPVRLVVDLPAAALKLGSKDHKAGERCLLLNVVSHSVIGDICWIKFDDESTITCLASALSELSPLERLAAQADW